MAVQMAREGKTILITGSTDGIGHETAVQLARMGARFFGVARDERKARRAERSIATASGAEDVHFLVCNLASMDQVARLAGRVIERMDRIDALINNAGVAVRSREETIDGFELTFAVNYLAHVLLTRLLLPKIVASAPARIIHLSSMVHNSGEIDLNDLHMVRGFDGWRAYCNSKLASLLFSNELARRLQGTAIATNALHPGVIDTKLLRVNFSGGSPVAEGARTPVYLATSPDVEGVSGRYFRDRKPAAPAPKASDPESALRLWDATERLLSPWLEDAD